MFPFVAWHGAGSSNSSARRPCSWQILQAIPVAGDLPREPRMQLRSLMPWAAQSLLVLGAFMACSFPPCSSVAWQILLGGSELGSWAMALVMTAGLGRQSSFLGLLQATVWSCVKQFAGVLPPCHTLAPQREQNLGKTRAVLSEQLLPGGFCFKLLASSRVSRDPASSQRQLRWEGSGQALCDPNKARCRLSGWCPEAGGAEAVLAAPALGYLLRGSRGQRCQSPHGCWGWEISTDPRSRGRREENTSSSRRIAAGRMPASFLPSAFLT